MKETDYNFVYVAAHASLGAVAREVIEAYGDDTMAHPVGTGAYQLKSWTRRSKIVLEANPEYRGFVWDFQPTDDPWDKALVRDDEGPADAAGRARRDHASSRKRSRAGSRSSRRKSTT